MDRLELMLNRASDADWTWGPLVAMRPARTERWGIAFWVKLTLLAFLTVEIVVVGALALRWSMTTGRVPWIDGLLDGLEWYLLRGTGTIAAVTLAGMLAGVSFFWAWNRRAARLCQMAASPPEGVAAPTEGVWPPAPKFPSSEEAH